MRDSIKTIENRLRRIAIRRGYRIYKNRRRDTRATDYGGYMLCDDQCGHSVFGCVGSEYNGILDSIESYLDSIEPKDKNIISKSHNEHMDASRQMKAVLKSFSEQSKKENKKRVQAQNERAESHRRSKKIIEDAMKVTLASFGMKPTGELK